jgi:hypothetical protein
MIEWTTSSPSGARTDRRSMAFITIELVRAEIAREEKIKEAKR